MDNNINFNNIPINKDVFVKHDADNNTPDNNGKSSKLKIIILGIVIAAIIGVLVVSIIAGSKKGRVDKETVKITSDVKEIEAGWGYQLEVTKNIDKDHHLVYESSNKEVVYINDVGYMTGVNPGEATVTVMVDENKSVKVLRGMGKISTLLFPHFFCAVLLHAASVLPGFYIAPSFVNTALTVFSKIRMSRPILQ